MAASSQPSSACKLMFNFIADDLFNNDDTCILVNQNCLSFKNFGRCQDIVTKDPYGDVAGLRKADRYLRLYAQFEDRGQEGDCIIKSPPPYSQGPTIVTLITQYGIGRPI